MSETIQRTKLYEDVTEHMLDHIRKVRWAFIAWEPVSVPRP